MSRTLWHVYVCGCQLYREALRPAHRLRWAGFITSSASLGAQEHLKSHCYVFAAHLYTHGKGKVRQWSSVLLGALLYVKGRSIPTLVGVLSEHLRLPPTVRHVWLIDSGIRSRPLLPALGTQEHFALGRLRGNHRVYFAPRRRSCGPRVFGPSCRVNQRLTRFPQRLRRHHIVLQVRGRIRP